MPLNRYLNEEDFAKLELDVDPSFEHYMIFPTDPYIILLRRPLENKENRLLFFERK